MSIDAIALLPTVANLRGRSVEGPWKEGKGPGGSRGLWCRVSDGTLLNLELPFQSPDSELHEAARRWAGSLPERIWVFPDTAVPDEGTQQALLDATRDVGRWVQAGPRPRSMLEELGFSPDDEVTFQREMRSGNAKRVAAAVALLEKRLQGREPAEVEALMAKLLRRG